MKRVRRVLREKYQAFLIYIYFGECLCIEVLFLGKQNVQRDLFEKKGENLLFLVSACILQIILLCLSILGIKFLIHLNNFITQTCNYVV